MEQTKICTRCNKDKTLLEFTKNSNGKFGRKSICRQCTKEAYTPKFKEKLLEGTKRCSKCKEVKDLESFHYNNKVKLLRYSICRLCLKNKTEEQKKIRSLQSVKNRAKRSEHYKAIRKERYDNNKERLLAQNKLYRESNKEKMREYARDYHNKKKKADPIYRLRKNLRSMTKRYINGKKSKRTTSIIGCSYIDFILYIEKKFESWMTWDNYGSDIPVNINETWDIDHIIPLSSAKTEEELYKLNHFTNLQPMCSYTNRWIKRNKYE